MAYPKETKWQYLALYPLEDVEKGRAPESGLFKVDLEHEILPAEEGEKKGKAMEVARWEMGFWEVVGETSTEGKEGGKFPFDFLGGGGVGWSGYGRGRGFGRGNGDGIN